MSTLPDFKTDVKRDATNSIRGYVYQAYQSVLAWMQLEENEILVLEGAEDFDIHFGSAVTTTQVKNVAGNLTLRSSDVVDSINNYWANSVRNPGYEIVLHFLATAEAGQEQGAPFGSGQKGLECWRSAEADDFDIEPLRTFLLTLKLESSLETFIKNAPGDELRRKLIRRIKWDIGNGPIDSIRYVIEDKLKVHGFKLGINSHDSCQALPNLFEEVADRLSTKGRKELTFGDFISSFDAATRLSIPRGEMEAMRSGNSLQLLAGMLDLGEMSRLVNRPPTIGRTLPVVDGGITRSTVVSKFSRLLREQRIIFLYGSSGLGKTNLASLISHEVGGSWGWAGFRSMPPDQIKDILARAAFEMNSAHLSPFLVLDDVDLSQVTQFEREFIALVFSVTSANGMVIITGPTRPPLQLLPKLWKNETSEVAVPYFEETEVAEMARVHGLSDDKRVSEWARTIWLTTSGHPQLVHARVRNLSAKGWPPIEFTDLTKPEDIERVRKEARGRLVQEFPSENTRVLAYRLSLTNGTFSRETAIAVAEIPTPTKLPGEAFDELVGPWIEREGENRYRVSPLLNGAANNVLSESEVGAVHGAIALSIIARKNIDQFEVGTAMFHAFMAKHVEALAKLAYQISMAKSKYTHLLYDAMSWFTFVGLEAGQKILPNAPSIDLMLRLVQYKLISSSPALDKALIIIERIEESLNAIDQPDIKPHSEALAYGMILNAYEVPIPSSTVIRILSRIIDLSEENSFLKEISDSVGESWVAIPRLGESKPAQILFSYQGARMKGLDDLLELATSLDALPSNKRDQLLRVCSSDMDFASLLINRAWWKDVKDGELDVNKALRVLEHVTIKSREWKVPELTKAGLVAMSVILDEYGHAMERALDILDAADKEFPEEASLVNQRAKVLFNANRNSEALPIANRALELAGLSNVEFVFCCRKAGIAAAKVNNWAEAKRLFLLGAEKAKHSSVQKSMGIGLMADAAFAAWQIKKYENSISTFANVLDSLGGIPLSEDIRIHHLHATVRHCISWIHFDALGTRPADFADPLPGVCSNQEPNERIKDHRIIDIGAAWDLLVSTERILDLSLGIKERGQAVTGGKKSLLMAGYERNVALDVIFMRKDFDNLATCLIEILEGLLHAKALKAGDKDEWSIGEIPKLPVGYLDDPKNWELIYLYLVEASVVCTVDQPNMPMPIEHWHSDFVKVCTLPDEANQFLNVLSGGSPNDSLYQQAAAAVFALRDGVLSPADLWKHSFRLLNATMHEKHLVKTALEGLLITRWIFAAGNQRFAFITPSLACPEIERCCLDQSLSGLSKVAAVLDIAAPYLNIRMSTDSLQMLKGIIKQGE